MLQDVTVLLPVPALTLSFCLLDLSIEVSGLQQKASSVQTIDFDSNNKTKKISVKYIISMLFNLNDPTSFFVGFLNKNCLFHYVTASKRHFNKCEQTTH